MTMTAMITYELFLLDFTPQCTCFILRTHKTLSRAKACRFLFVGIIPRRSLRETPFERTPTSTRENERKKQKHIFIYLLLLFHGVEISILRPSSSLSSSTKYASFLLIFSFPRKTVSLLRHSRQCHSKFRLNDFLSNG